jgi:hypothetical protein
LEGWKVEGWMVLNFENLRVEGWMVLNFEKPANLLT